MRLDIFSMTVAPTSANSAKCVGLRGRVAENRREAGCGPCDSPPSAALASRHPLPPSSIFPQPGVGQFLADVQLVTSSGQAAQALPGLEHRKAQRADCEAKLTIELSTLKALPASRR